MQTQRRTGLLVGCLVIPGVLGVGLFVFGAFWVLHRVSLYRQIFQRLQATPISDAAEQSLTAVRQGKATAADLQTARNILTLHAPEIRLTERAAALPDCDFHRAWQLGPDLLLPEYGEARKLVRLLATQAVMQNDAGHPQEALRSVAVIAHVGRHIAADPIVIAMLMRLAIESIGDSAWQHIVKTHSNDPAVLHLAAQTDREFGPPPDFRHAIRGEMVMGHIVLDELRHEKYQNPIRRSDGAMMHPVNEVVDAYEARYLAYWRRAFQTLEATPNDPLATYFALKKVGDKEDSEEQRIKVTYELNAILSPVFSNSYLKTLSCEAKRRLRHTLLALLAFRQRTGTSRRCLLPSLLPRRSIRLRGIPCTTAARRTALSCIASGRICKTMAEMCTITEVLPR